TLTLDPQQNFRFQAFGRTQAGDSVPVTVRWTTSAGLISTTGVYTADTSAVDATITATLSTTTVSATSRVRNRLGLDLHINPKSLTLPEGGLQSFVAYGLRNTGDSINIPVPYTATGGTISSGGQFTAGQTPGNYRVVATQSNGALADTSAVTV